MTGNRVRRQKIVALPRDGIPYNTCLYAAAAKLGLHVIEGIWSGRWLLRNVEHGDLVHIHWPSFYYYDSTSRFKTYAELVRFAAVLAALRLRGAGIAWTAHNLYPHVRGSTMLAHRIARQIVVRFANVVYAHGPTAAAIAAEEFNIPARKLRVIKHGHWIDFHAQRESAAVARAELGIDSSSYVYAFVGSCRPYKNLTGLIKAFEQLPNNSVLLIAGKFASSEHRSTIEALLENIPKHRWRLHDKYIDDADIHRYVLAGDALVLPYTEVLTSGSAMMGLSFGRPVVAPNSGGLRDMISDDCGVLYEAGDEGLVNAMRRVRELRFSEQALIKHARSFDWSDPATALAQSLKS